MAWQVTYGLPPALTNCTSHCRPYHFPEKLIPLIMLNALEGKPLSVNGDGRQARDWSFVDGDLRVLVVVLDKGRVGESVILGVRAPKHHIDVVEHIAISSKRCDQAARSRDVRKRHRDVGPSAPRVRVPPSIRGLPASQARERRMLEQQTARQH